jgi:hypothetical protein
MMENKLVFDDRERAIRAAAERKRTQPTNGKTTTETPPDISPQWPEPLTAPAFSGLAGEYVRTVGPSSEADPAALLLQFLVAAGNAIGHRPYYLTEDTPHFLNFYAVLIGLTSKSRKGTSWARVKKFFAAIDEPWVMHSIVSGLSSGEGLIEAVRDPDGGEDPGASDKRLLITQGEFCGVLRVMERDGNTLSMVLRDAWDGIQLRTMTRKSSALRANGSHISMIGHITRDELRSGLTETDKANGFANRILWACIARSKELPEEVEINPAAWSSLISRVKSAMEFARSIERMQRTEDAKILWRKVYHDLSEGQPGMFGACTSRGEALVVRLSCLYALLDRSPEVDAGHLQSALALWHYCEDSARYVFGDQIGDPLADRILAALRQSSEEFTRTDIYNLCGRNKSTAQIGAALTVLRERGLISLRNEPTEGRPVELWSAVRGE